MRDEPDDCRAALIDDAVADHALRCEQYAGHIGPHRAHHQQNIVTWALDWPVTVTPQPEGEPPW